MKNELVKQTVEVKNKGYHSGLESDVVVWTGAMQ